MALSERMGMDTDYGFALRNGTNLKHPSGYSAIL